MWLVAFVLTLSQTATIQSADERLQEAARAVMGEHGCPDVLRPSEEGGLVATVLPHWQPAGTARRLLIDLEIRNVGHRSERVEKRYFSKERGRPRTDYLWIFDRMSGKWIRYVGPSGRLRAREPSDFIVVLPGEAKKNSNLDITNNYKIPAQGELLAKVLISSPWESYSAGERIESRCVPVPP